MKKTILACVIAAVLCTAGFLLAAAAKPTSVIHVVTVKWKDGTTPEQIAAALKGVEAMSAKFPGIRRVWLRSVKVQGADPGYTHAFVMEFESEQALADYADSPAQLDWYKLYVPIREESRTFDITN